MVNRRQFLAGSSAAVALSAALPAWAQASTPIGAPSGTPSGAGASLTALLETFFQEDLRRRPEAATNLGLDTGDLAGLRSRLGDRSAAGQAVEREAAASQMRRLAGIDRRSLSGIDAVNYDCVAYVLSNRLETYKRFDFGRPGERSPYAISQLTGCYQSTPTFLDTKHPIATQDDAEAYLSRLEAFATALDHDTERLDHDRGAGVVAPDFLLDTTLTQMRALRVDADKSDLVSSVAKRAKAKGIEGDWAARAAGIYTSKVLPALDRQIAAVEAARRQATHHAGVWHVKDGDAWYVDGLRANTTTTLSPDEVHNIGLDQGREITARLDAVLKAQGLTKGTVGQRIKALYQDPASFYPKTEEGKAQLIADLGVRLADVVSHLPQYFSTLPKAKAEVKPVPAQIDAGAPLAYYQSPSLDGKRPATIYFNLHDTGEWPKWALPSTLYHEGIPGHHLQVALAQETAGIPRYRSNMFFSGYGEGWALYAEQLADEMGMYEKEPMGRIGYLKFLLFRAGRCVIDTGMHHKRWTREQAVKYMVDLTGDTESAMTRETDRYCAWPGQACSYKIGHTMWVRLRDQAKKELGPKFDIREFHHAGLSSGSMPLDVLSLVIQDYITARKAA
ncbi:DUF885 domain-containing protein [Nitrospirillum amazonense]|uniref:DUF885 domain-containing protein n=1 Tax=Nitrospirillum amazonense TaxID=28077 RepID=UPI0024125D8E|nr:DUF885 family protein [Nitrospirillum amazonense]MDG3438852.1 DUF885 family protein [Nitrospirillum amazonense]